jgi:hypothetical protein
MPLAKIAWSGQKQGLRGPGRDVEIVSCASEHDPEKWKPVFGKDHAQPMG